MVAVAVLVVIAVAGIVLAGLHRPSPSETSGSDATQEGGSSLTAAAAAAAASVAAQEAAAGPNQIVFAPASDQLSDAAASKVLRLAERARKEHRAVAIVSKVEPRPGRADEMDLARKRSMAVRRVLEANGIPLGSTRIEISRLPTGLVSVPDVNWVELALR